MESVWQINTPTSPILTDIEQLLIHTVLFQAWEIQFWNAKCYLPVRNNYKLVESAKSCSVKSQEINTWNNNCSVFFFSQTCSYRVSQESATDQQHLQMVLALLCWGVPAEELSTSQGANAASTTQLQAHPWHTTHGSNA